MSAEREVDSVVVHESVPSLPIKYSVSERPEGEETKRNEPCTGEDEHDERSRERRVVGVPRPVRSPSSETEHLGVHDRPHQEEDEPEAEDVADRRETRSGYQVSLAGSLTR